jgi:transcriptional regulator with XRE-family HTH domain
MKNRIRELREVKGWSLSHLAELAGTSKGYISTIERGERTGGIKVLKNIASALGVQLSDIFPAEGEAGSEILELMDDYMKLSDTDREDVRRHCKGLLSLNRR